MKKVEIQNKIDELEKQLAELKEQVKTIEDKKVQKSERQKPEYGTAYYYINDQGYISYTTWLDCEVDIYRFNTGNCFRIEQEAKDYKENLLTKQKLKDLAFELNNGVGINWYNYDSKYYIRYNYTTEKLSRDCNLHAHRFLDVYCLDANFLTIAKERIGKEKLIKLIKSGV